MKVTKFVHACLLVETPNRVALFDPGMMSVGALDPTKLDRLDDIFITHAHGDHFDIDLLKQLVAKFPEVRITTTAEMAAQLKENGITASNQAPNGALFFDSPHEQTVPLFPQPEEVGIHYLDSLTHPGDSHSFSETKAILALPVAPPWGSTITGVNLALQLKPKHVLPIHDWHWSEDARHGMYGLMEGVFAKEGITFHKLETGQPVEIAI